MLPRPESGTQSAEPRRRIKDALRGLVLDHPFFGLLALRLELKEDYTATTMWVDGVKLGYCPAFVADLTDAELSGVICHEVLHVVAGHPWRRGFRSEVRWNQACDFAINPLVRDAGLTLPAGVLLDPAFQGQPAELIYDKLPEPVSGSAPEDSPTGAGAPEPGADGVSSTGPEDDSQSEGDVATTNNEDREAQGDDGPPDSASTSTSPGPPGDPGGRSDPGDASGTSTESHCGAPPAGLYANSKVPSQDLPQRVSIGEVRDAPADRARELEADWKMAVETAASAAGDLPGSLTQLIAVAKASRVDWREALRAFVHQSLQSLDYDARWPNRRYLGLGLYLPALVGEGIGCVVIAIDTSGSVSDALLCQFHGEVKAVLEEVRPATTVVMYADAAVQRVEEIFPEDEFHFEAPGRGGTSFIPVFERIARDTLAPECLIYLTDLEGPMPQTAPDYPVLWVTPPTPITPAWGYKIEIEPWAVLGR